MAFAPFHREGVGIHTGAPSTVFVRPRPGTRGIVFSTAEGEIPVGPENLAQDARNATDLVSGRARVRTVEHILAALAWYGIDGAVVELDGPEVPILDGSAKPWCEALLAAGCRPGPRFVRLGAPIAVRLGSSGGEIVPLGDGDAPTIAVKLDFGGAPVGARTAEFCPTRDDFATRIGPARTFALASQIEGLRAAGLAGGGSLDNALVIGESGPLNPEGLRFPDEPARHKILDAMGDLAILGGLPWAAIRLERPSHALHRALLAEARPLLVG